MTQADRIKEIVEFAINSSDSAAEDNFGISHESLRRYKRHYKQMQDDTEGIIIEPSVERLMNEIRDRYSPDELRVLARGSREQKVNKTINAEWFTGDVIHFGIISDTHIGSKYFREDWYDGAIDRFYAHGVDFIIHTGDVTEGLSNRPGHIYELSHIGYDAQRKEAERQLSKINIPMYLVDGNHDRWYVKSSGAYIVKDICEKIDNLHYMGNDEGVLNIGGISIMLWHGEDGAAYALSYRVQKIVESLSGGRKPSILVTGHDHKQGFFFQRNIQVIMGACLQEQTPWMRSKRLAAHPGFWIASATVHDGSIVEFGTKFFPYYD